MLDTWVNGIKGDTVSVLDRGFSYGDGIFTTIKVSDGQCQLLTQHLVRLQQGISALAITQIDFTWLLDDLTQKAHDLVEGVLKVIITRGQGQRGYSSIGCDSPTIVISSGTIPAVYQQWQTQGIALGVSTVALGINPLTAGLKHLNRLEQVLVKQQIDENSWTDAIVLDCQAHIIETSMANIFWRTADNVYTPSLHFSGVKGLMRQQVIEQLDASDLTIVEDLFKLSSVMNADEVFITNCLMGVVPINAIESTTFRVGDTTTTLAKALNNKDGL